jgi:hypothetical protein
MPSQLLQIRGIFPVALGLIAIRSPRLPQIAPAQRGSTGSALCRAVQPTGGPLVDISYRPCEGGWLLL